MRIGIECGEFNVRRIMAESSIADMRMWGAYFRLQAKELEKNHQDATAVRARDDAKRRLERGPNLT